MAPSISRDSISAEPASLITFSLFQKLPTEIRLQIWGLLLLATGRVVELRRNCYIPFATASPSNPAIFSTCKESRNEAFRCSNGNLLTIRPSARFRPSIRIHFNFVEDTLYLNSWKFCWKQAPNLSNPPDGDISACLGKLISDIHPSDIALIQNLAVNWFPGSINFDGSHFPERLYKFKGLQSLTVVLCERRVDGGPTFFANTRNVWETDLVDIIWLLLENFVSILTDHPSWKKPRVDIVTPACSPEKENSESVLHSALPYRRRELDFAAFFNDYFGI